ncbi:MAG: Rrf2 family transcriptional regulator [Candidatus Omnitrophota bacterium]|jgi:Rrf2 family protein
MKLITRDTDYAIRALLFIAKEKQEIVSVSRLVKSLEIPRPFLRKILQRLNKKGLLNSYKGQGGGFSLRVAADRIFLLDLIEIFQGRMKLNECVFKKRICPNIKTCKLKKKIDSIQRYIISELGGITLTSLFKK